MAAESVRPQPLLRTGSHRGGAAESIVSLSSTTGQPVSKYAWADAIAADVFWGYLPVSIDFSGDAGLHVQALFRRMPSPVDLADRLSKEAS